MCNKSLSVQNMEPKWGRMGRSGWGESTEKIFLSLNAFRCIPDGYQPAPFEELLWACEWWWWWCELLAATRAKHRRRQKDEKNQKLFKTNGFCALKCFELCASKTLQGKVSSLLSFYCSEFPFRCKKIIKRRDFLERQPWRKVQQTITWLTVTISFRFSWSLLSDPR